MPVILREPSEQGFERSPYKFTCNKQWCTFSVTAKSEQDAHHADEIHKCPHLGGPTKLGWTVTKTLVSQMWEALDETMVDLMAAKLEHEKAPFKIRARAQAEMIAIFMPPFFRTADEVSREALNRWQHIGSLEPYETPGLGSRRYELAAGAPRGTYTSEPNQTSEQKRGRVTSQRRSPTLSEKDQAAVKFAYQTDPKSFTPEKLASTFRVSIPEVKLILGI